MDEVEFDQVTNEEYYGQLKLMFASLGWQYLMTEMAADSHLLNDVQSIRTNDQLLTTQGKLEVMGTLLNFEETVRRLEEENDESPE